MKYNLVPALIVCAAAMNGPAFADSRDDVLATAARCLAIADHRAWLDCYYGAAQPLRAELGLPSAPPSQTRLVPNKNVMPVPFAAAPTQTTYAPPPPPVPVRKNSGGIFSSVLGGATLEGKTHISAYSFDKNGVFTVTLADGEVWRQLDENGGLARWDKPASRYVVSITQGAFGSYNLLVDNDNGSYKVRRIR